MHQNIAVLASIVFVLALAVSIFTMVWHDAFFLSVGMLSLSAALFGAACYMKLEEMDNKKESK